MYLARALVAFPGGYGTMDELFEVLTLLQTRKVQRPVTVIVYGREYWEEVVNFDKLREWGTISDQDLNLIHVVNDVDEAFAILTDAITSPKAGKSG
jgi:predicted Rossmann-fold nucleotide-binding protein